MADKLEYHINRMYINLLEINKDTQKQVAELRQINQHLKEQNRLLSQMLDQLKKK